MTGASGRRCELRVAAYCRVSTLMEQQESSYEAQVQYYTEKIKVIQLENWRGFMQNGMEECNQ